MAEVIDIPSSPEEIPRHVQPKLKSKRPARYIQGPVIELTDSESDSEPKAGPSSQRARTQLSGSGSSENIPASSQRKAKVSAKRLPLFLPSDEENQPPAVLPQPAQNPRDANRVEPPNTLPQVANVVPHLQPMVPAPLQPPEEMAVEGLQPDAEPLDPISIYVAQVLEIIPDIEPEHLLNLINKHVPQYQDEVVQHVLHILFEDPTYPKVVKPSKGKRKAEELNGTDIGGPSKSKPKIDYAAVDREFAGGVHYDNLALTQLQIEFPFIPKPYLRRVLFEHRRLYAPTHLFLAAQQRRHGKEGGPLPYVSKSTPFHAKGKAPQLQDDEFDKERNWLIAHLDKGEDEDGTVGAANEVEEDCEDAGDGMECGCCFSSYPFDKMVQCPEAHLFCSTCMNSYCSTQLGEHNIDIVCMHQSGCKLHFPASELRRILPEKLMNLYERVKQQKEIAAAGLENLEECPFCEWKCVIENEAERLFHCGNEDGGCGVVSCRGCKKVDHLPKTCKEMEEDKLLDGRHAIEEAMSLALMRNCPKCTKAFIKESGCNKMTCPNCQTLSCYVCRQAITGYEHFHENRGQATTSKNAGKCLLHDEVEKRHADEVRAAAGVALAQYQRDHPDVEEKDIEVELPPAPPPIVPPQHGIYPGFHQPVFAPYVHIPPIPYYNPVPALNYDMFREQHARMQAEAQRLQAEMQEIQANAQRQVVRRAEREAAEQQRRREAVARAEARRQVYEARRQANARRPVQVQKRARRK